MGEIKSAFERAMERADRLGKASEEDQKKWKYTPEGEAIAAKCLKDDCDLVAELAKYDASARPHVAKGALGVLVSNIDMPKNEIIKKRNKKAMDAIKELKQNKVAVENVFTNMRRVFTHYDQQGKQQLQQAYEALKRDFEAKVRQAIQQQYGQSGPMPEKLDVERQPQFQEQWRMVQARFESQYSKLMEEYRQQLLNLP